jgi:hypothetical protein
MSNASLLMPMADPNVVAFAEKILADARTGAITSLGAVTVVAGGQINAGYVGARGGDVYIGCDMLKTMLMGQFTGQNSSRIVRAS